MRPTQVHAALQREARARGRLAQEVMTLYGLERFLARLAQTEHAEDFALKGGVLLAAYRLRRPTRDIDMQALDFPLDEAHLRTVVERVAAVDSDDALVLDTSAVTVTRIRDEEEYDGLRLTVPARVHTFRFPLKLDISTGDPIWPATQHVDLPAILGGHVTVLGHPLPTVIAEKTVTVLQRGTTSTRWRDYVDVRGLSRTYPFLAGDLRSAAQAVADHRQVELGPLAAVTTGYGDVAQPKWSAWLRTNDMTDLAEPVFDDQLAAITAFVDPVYDGTVNTAAVWNPTTSTWEPGDVQVSGESRR